MKENKLVMKELAPFKRISNRFENSLLSAIEQFRKGYDHLGLDNFLNCIADLEILFELHQYAEERWRSIDHIVPVIETLYVFVQNQDVVGLTDLLEFKLYPLTTQWIEGCGE